jgi:hypothetical protein
VGYGILSTLIKEKNKNRDPEKSFHIILKTCGTTSSQYVTKRDLYKRKDGDDKKPNANKVRTEHKKSHAKMIKSDDKKPNTKKVKGDDKKSNAKTMKSDEKNPKKVKGDET